MTQGMPYPGSPGPLPSPSSPNIYQQIEGSADLYAPNLYELLTRYSSLQTQPDELDGQFIPLTDVPATPNTGAASRGLLFAVGVLPPSSNVTGQLLDRSATIAQSIPIQGGIPLNTKSADSKATASVTPSGAAGRATEGPIGVNQGPPVKFTYSVGQLGQAISAAYQDRFGRLPTQQELAIYVTQSLRETGGQWPNNNPGFIGNYYKTAGTVSENGQPDPQGLRHAAIPAGQQVFSFVQPNGSIEYYNSYSTPKAGAAAFLKTIASKGGVDFAQNGDYHGYLQQLHDKGYFTDSVEHYEKFSKDPNVIAQQLAAAGVPVLPGPSLNQVAGGDGSSTSNNWKSTGSQNAGAAQKGISNTANTNMNLNGSSLGQQFQQAQLAMIQNTIAAIGRMQQTPPLKMLVNPQSFRVNYEKIISDGEWGRSGPIVEHWGDGQDKIEASGKIAAFYALDAGTSFGSPPSGGPGITRIARQYSKSYQNFLSLWLLYKNNGGVWFGDYVSQVSGSSTSQATNLSVVGSIYIYYDNTLYFGSFDNFNITESETAPYTLEYTFSFTVRATFLLDNVDTQLSYGAPPQTVSGQDPPNQTAIQPGTNPLQPNYQNAPLPTFEQLALSSPQHAGTNQLSISDIINRSIQK